MWICTHFHRAETIFKPEIIISGLAFLVSIITLLTQRKHNHNSLRPYGVVECGDYEDDIYVKIKNAGTGPLIFKNLSVTHTDGRTMGNIVQLMPDLPDNMKWADFIFSGENKALSPGETLALLQFSPNNVILDPEISDGYGILEETVFAPWRKKVRQQLSGITVRLEYTDVYNNNFHVVQNLNYLYGRHSFND